ncbi:hypothetical protein LXL04_037776 [Taraxacum kok-saghyz]
MGSGFGFEDARPHILANEPELDEEVLSFWGFFLSHLLSRKQLMTFGGSLKSSSVCINSVFQITDGSLGTHA